MTAQELIIKLEECRNHLDDIKEIDDRANEAYYTLNDLISDIEDNGVCEEDREELNLNEND